MSNTAVTGAMLVLFAAGLGLGWVLVRRGEISSRWKRVLTALTVFAVIFWGGPVLMQYDIYDVYVEAVRLLTAVLGAGLYWAGSRE